MASIIFNPEEGSLAESTAVVDSAAASTAESNALSAGVLASTALSEADSIASEIIGNIDGGHANSSYLISQNISGGNA